MNVIHKILDILRRDEQGMELLAVRINTGRIAIKEVNLEAEAELELLVTKEWAKEQQKLREENVGRKKLAKLILEEELEVELKQISSKFKVRKVRDNCYDYLE